eukprot:3241508-Karenia_brevis.AAC.1
MSNTEIGMQANRRSVKVEISKLDPNWKMWVSRIPTGPAGGRCDLLSLPVDPGRGLTCKETRSSSLT